MRVYVYCNKKILRIVNEEKLINTPNNHLLFSNFCVSTTQRL